MFKSTELIFKSTELKFQSFEHKFSTFEHNFYIGAIRLGIAYLFFINVPLATLISGAIALIPKCLLDSTIEEARVLV